MAMEIRVGCCGFPQAREKYFAHLRLVEVQQTFYQPPQPATAERWRAEAPPGFVYCLKAWQLITHPATSPTYRRLREPLPPEAHGRVGFFRPTPEVWAAWERTREMARLLEAAVIVFQCPASFLPTPEHVEDLRRFFERVDRGAFRFAWEPRGPWPEDLVRGLCRDLDLIHCVDPFQGLPVTFGVAYFRLHGIGGYGYRYTLQDLRRLLAWCQGYEQAYVLFNNASMWEDALAFADLLGQGGLEGGPVV
jgi:uncharacterized protein YecE (DUF72 family)